MSLHGLVTLRVSLPAPVAGCRRGGDDEGSPAETLGLGPAGGSVLEVSPQCCIRRVKRQIRVSVVLKEDDPL